WSARLATGRGVGYSSDCPGLIAMRPKRAAADFTTGNDVLRMRCLPTPVDGTTTSLRWPSTARSLQALGAILMMFALGVPAFAEPRVIMKGHTLALGGLAYSADGLHVATGSYDHTAKVWEAATGKELVTLAGHGATVEGVAFSPDGKFLATGSYDGTVKLWEWTAGKELATLAGHSSMIRSLAYSPDGKT